MSIRFDRLQKVVTHLKGDKIGHAKFDFSKFHQEPTFLNKIFGHCGSNGCAIGELPLIFPQSWEFCPITSNFDGTLIGKGIRRKGTPSMVTGKVRTSVEEFFGLNQAEAIHLFWPENQTRSWLPPSRDGEALHKDASKAEVVENMEYFIANAGFRKQQQDSEIVQQATEIVNQKQG